MAWRYSVLGSRRIGRLRINRVRNIDRLILVVFSPEPAALWLPDKKSPEPAEL